MTEKDIRISFNEYKSIEELGSEDAQLVREAIAAMEGSFAPYSHFNVGAAIRKKKKKIVKGANQENAAYPSGMCAERSAMFAASSQFPNDPMCSIAIAGGLNGELDPNPVSPCGACRQVMAQYQLKSGLPMKVLLVGAHKIWKFEKIDDLLPLIFDSI